MKHVNIAIFVPHNGCPHQCSFCNQKSITGKQYQPGPDDVYKAAEIAARSLNHQAAETEIAFFGGSFTLIRRDVMISLLKAADWCRKQYGFSGIRISTRPDGIDRDILGILKEYGVTSIELGAQSMDNTVLKKNGRGHTAEQVETASRLIQQNNFFLGLQMMTGLWGDDPEGAIRTAEKIISLRPDCVRIYPTIVMEGTELARRYRCGEYSPMDLETAVSLCADLLVRFKKNNIPVIRVGLHDTPELKHGMICGPYHPAFRELCESRYFRNQLEAALPADCKLITVAVNPKDVSRFVGQKRSNVEYFRLRGYQIEVKQDSAVRMGTVEIL